MFKIHCKKSHSCKKVTCGFSFAAGLMKVNICHHQQQGHSAICCIWILLMYTNLSYKGYTWITSFLLNLRGCSLDCYQYKCFDTGHMSNIWIAVLLNNHDSNMWFIWIRSNCDPAFCTTTSQGIFYRWSPFWKVTFFKVHGLTSYSLALSCLLTFNGFTADVQNQ